MQSSFRVLGGWTASLAAGLTSLAWSAGAMAEDRMGEPTPGGIALQPGVTPLRQDAVWFHDWILMPIITVITLFVAGLLIWCVVRYNKRANPIPARWSHNTVIEVIWTLAPVLILVFISIFSFRLLFAYHDFPKTDVTIKATGYQWYWTYEYPDLQVGEFVSNILPEEDAAARKVPFKLAVTEPLVVPVNKNVRVLVTGADVIHAFAVPSFGIIADAVPGRVNETWFRADRIGIYYGNCRELCGTDHAFMPIEVRVVSQADFDAWVASKGGGAATPAAAAEAAATPAVAVAPAAPSAINPAAAGTGTPEPSSTATPPAAAAPAAPAAAAR